MMCGASKRIFWLFGMKMRKKVRANAAGEGEQVTTELEGGKRERGSETLTFSFHSL